MVVCVTSAQWRVTNNKIKLTRSGHSQIIHMAETYSITRHLMLIQYPGDVRSRIRLVDGAVGADDVTTRVAVPR